jgi:hypothetical protein
MWMNLLAHGSVNELLSARNAEIRSLHKSRSEGWAWISREEWWYNARSYLAAEVLDIAATHEKLKKLQHQILIPLEEKRAAAGCTDLDDPRDFVAEVMAALDSHRRSQQHSDQ